MTYEEPEDSADPEPPSSASAQHPALAGWSTADERSFWGFHDDRYKPYLYFAYKQLGSDADAEDAADKTFDEIMNNWQRMLGMENLPGYAWSILKSRISDQRRKLRQAGPADRSFRVRGGRRRPGRLRGGARPAPVRPGDRAPEREAAGRSDPAVRAGPRHRSEVC
ncbi:hypothetical protein [Streptomyces sp. NBC_00162]|uniref:hypothetical protein n=1 Tax=Streptomyces sp. NBC_00162 TaxID=2903629 RepID=UPI00214BC7D4|nr:hypothetical protein [Streptomyces sp. NBC_00162]UUU37802.1 hypothetical protein JIW86_02120 [Streptomyces sp. NBC_00162]